MIKLLRPFPNTENMNEHEKEKAISKWKKERDKFEKDMRKQNNLYFLSIATIQFFVIVIITLAIINLMEGK